MAISGTSELAAKPPQRTTTPPPAPVSVSVSAQKPRNIRTDSLEFPETDPWGSPAIHRGHNHEAGPPKPNGISRKTSNGIHEPARTTSNFTTGSVEESNGASNQPSSNAPPAPTTGGWGTFEATAGGDFGNSTETSIGGGVFGNPGDGADGPPSAPSRSFGDGRVTAGGVEENIVITLLPEKEGIFMFQHHNYQVESARRDSKVIRRYSDFVWLLDCLQKRYPFRQLPLLPPKRVGGKSSLLSRF
jgi:sorting nexin-8